MSETHLEAKRKARVTVLLAEDDPDQSDMLCEKLESEGFAVEAVFSGDVALRRLTSRDYAAAIMDARMPGLHGGAVLKTYKGLGGPSATPIIMVSAFASPGDLAQFKLDGAAGSFSKPLKFAELLGCLRNVTGSDA